MSAVQEIVHAIVEHDASRLAELKAWLLDQETEEDEVAGRLNPLAGEVRSVVPREMAGR
jgi:hypothetical protein